MFVKKFKLYLYFIFYENDCIVNCKVLWFFSIARTVNTHTIQYNWIGLLWTGRLWSFTCICLCQAGMCCGRPRASSLWYDMCSSIRVASRGFLRVLTQTTSRTPNAPPVNSGNTTPTKWPPSPAWLWPLMQARDIRCFGGVPCQCGITVHIHNSNHWKYITDRNFIKVLI